MKQVLLLPFKDVESLLDYSEVIKAVESAFREKGLGYVQMVPKPYLFFSEYNGDLRVMPAYMTRLAISGVKIVNVHPDNSEKYGLPTVMATIILVDPKTGKPMAVMDGTLITAWRTGAAGAVAAKYLARKDSKIMGIIGAGVQGRMQALFTSKVLDIEKIKIWDIRREKAEAYSKEMSEVLGMDVEVAEEPSNAVKDVDVLATCTPSRKPIVKAEWISSGMHINAIGADAPGKEELDPTVLKMAKIVIDDWEQSSHSGEINVPLSKGIISKENIYAELGEIVAGKKLGRVSDDEITIFDSTGLAIQDVATANLFYTKALEKNVGLRVELVKM